MNKEARSKHQLIMNRFYMIAISLFIFALFLIGKLIYIQFYENDLGLGLEPDALVKNIVLEPSRGNIYAADGNILATSISRYELYWDTVTPSEHLFNSYKKALSDSIAMISTKSSAQILKMIERLRSSSTDFDISGGNGLVVSVAKSMLNRQIGIIAPTILIPAARRFANQLNENSNVCARPLPQPRSSCPTSPRTPRSRTSALALCSRA